MNAMFLLPPHSLNPNGSPVPQMTRALQAPTHYAAYVTLIAATTATTSSVAFAQDTSTVQGVSALSGRWVLSWLSHMSGSCRPSFMMPSSAIRAPNFLGFVQGVPHVCKPNELDRSFERSGLSIGRPVLALAHFSATKCSRLVCPVDVIPLSSSTGPHALPNFAR